jgi:ubiquinone/menaquinone biosynthesis C-methylase UbiE
VLDVGAGDGSVLAEIERRALAETLNAVEISGSGIERIKGRNLKTLKSVQSFDGYHLPFADNAFDTVLVAHVLEHVEHERMFLKEISRVARRCYIEVPLEHTVRLQRSIQSGKRYGHINYYTMGTFRNLVGTADLLPVASRIFGSSRDYEIFLSGQTIGGLKHLIRSTALKIAPELAASVFVYIGAIFCEHQPIDGAQPSER